MTKKARRGLSVKIFRKSKCQTTEIESADGGIPSAIIPVQIIDYLKLHYPDAVILEYEIGKRSYEVKLSNRLELKFSNRFNLIEIDD